VYPPLPPIMEIHKGDQKRQELDSVISINLWHAMRDPPKAHEVVNVIIETPPPPPFP